MIYSVRNAVGIDILDFHSVPAVIRCRGQKELSVRINMPSFLQAIADDLKAVEVEGGTVGECLASLVERFPGARKLLFDEGGKLLSYVEVFVNGESAYPQDSAKPVNGGDELYIFFAIAGG